MVKREHVDFLLSSRNSNSCRCGHGFENGLIPSFGSEIGEMAVLKGKKGCCASFPCFQVHLANPTPAEDEPVSRS
jgi:hypothetical protein